MKNVNIVEELKKYLKNTPKEQQQKDWEEIKKYGEFGPRVDEFLCGTISNEDRRKEIHDAALKCHPNSNYSDLIQCGFREGAEWADSHPNK